MENSTLPKGWEIKTLGELTYRITKGSTPTSYGYSYKESGINFIKTENIIESGIVQEISDFIDEETNQFLSRSILQAQDILFSIAGTIGRVGIVQEKDLPANTNQALAIIRGKWDVALPKYVFYFLKSPIIQQSALKSIVGVGRANLSLKNVSEFNIPLPPFPEQERIVSRIEGLFSDLEAGVAALERVRAGLQRYKASVLKAACEGKLVKQDPNDEPSRKLLEKIGKVIVDETNEELPELPNGWCWTTIEQLARDEKYSLAIGPFGSNLKVSDYKDRGIPLVFVRNIRSGNFDDTHFVSEKKAKELSAHQITGSDILITKMGEPPGDACLYPATKPDAVITADCIKWRVHLLFEEKRFFVHIINSHVMQKQIQKITRGVAQKKVSLERFRKLFFPLPPLNEQQRIVAEVERRLSVAQEVESAVDAGLARAGRLRQSVLRSAFEGKLS